MALNYYCQLNSKRLIPIALNSLSLDLYTSSATEESKEVMQVEATEIAVLVDCHERVEDEPV